MSRLTRGSDAVMSSHLKFLLRQLVKQFLGLSQRVEPVQEKWGRVLVRVLQGRSSAGSPLFVPAQLGASLRGVHGAGRLWLLEV